jgi:hypothetical protein
VNARQNETAIDARGRMRMGVFLFLRLGDVQNADDVLKHGFVKCHIEGVEGSSGIAQACSVV